MKKATQYFTDEYLERCRELQPRQIVEFLEGFRELHLRKAPARSVLISMKVPDDLLRAFRSRAELEGVPYQTLIKQLMREWLTRPA